MLLIALLLVLGACCAHDMVCQSGTRRIDTITPPNLRARSHRVWVPAPAPEPVLEPALELVPASEAEPELAPEPEPEPGPGP